MHGDGKLLQEMKCHEIQLLLSLFQITLVAGHSLYIDVTQLQALKNRSKKSPSRIVRELLSYYFTPEYLGYHSATGSKTTKKGLPSAITDPIRGNNV